MSSELKRKLSIEEYNAVGLRFTRESKGRGTALLVKKKIASIISPFAWTIAKIPSSKLFMQCD